MKTCTKCGKEKPSTEFSNNVNCKDGLQQWCRACMSQGASEYIRTHKANDPEYLRKFKIRHMASARKCKYGLTPIQYDQMVEDQKGVCKICGKENKDVKALAVDHDHITGKVRGLLCRTCNTKLNVVEDIEFNQKAFAYLLESSK